MMRRDSGRLDLLRAAAAAPAAASGAATSAERIAAAEELIRLLHEAAEHDHRGRTSAAIEQIYAIYATHRAGLMRRALGLPTPGYWWERGGAVPVNEDSPAAVETGPGPVCGGGEFCTDTECSGHSFREPEYG